MNKKLAKRPLDPKRQLPVPFMQAVGPDGLADFTMIDGGKVIQSGQQRICGLCGKPLGLYVAFLGGPVSAQTHEYSDPPMHPDCADDATRLCPHLARQRVPRRESTGVMPEGFAEEKPEGIVMLVVSDYTLVRRPVKGGSVPGFTAGEPKQVRTYSYVDGLLTEDS